MSNTRQCLPGPGFGCFDETIETGNETFTSCTHVRTLAPTCSRLQSCSLRVPRSSRSHALAETQTLTHRH
eukprot:1013769-Rhodomonas_salina.1